MEIANETRRKLREMGANDLANAFLAQDDDIFIGMPCAERLQVAVDEAYSTFITQKVVSLVSRARLRYPDADMRSLDYDEKRGLDRTMIAELSSCTYIDRATNVVLHGLTGTGKSYLACALAKEACRHRLRTSYIRVPDLFDKWLEVKEKPNGTRKLIRKYAAFSVLVLDEWLLDKPDDGFCSVLFELMEMRYGKGATIFCTQYRNKDWHARLGGDVRADAIMDRIVHNAIYVEMGDFNMRKKYGGSYSS